jgi:flagellar L-ring protein precursor FlgH
VNRLLSLLVIPCFLAACQSQQTATTGGSPPLSVVGQGLTVKRADLPTAFSEPDVHAPHSLWSHSNQGLFQDLRARKVGDIVTVAIDINDMAQFDNTSGRSKAANAKGNFGFNLGWGGFGMPEGKAGTASADLTASGSADAKGTGTIDRSEKLHLAIAAVVTEVLPGGNLLISGSQEVRVNHEVRVLTLAGIVRPYDIADNNLVAYDKIAEARISYGGRGKISEMQ